MPNNKPNHTPGPWYTDGTKMYAPETRFRGQDEPIAEISIDSEHWPFDAQLIAAAPDMLRALKKCVTQLEQYIDNSEYDQEMTKAVNRLAKNAIAKAEGK